jgi:hypothetical protein
MQTGHTWRNAAWLSCVSFVRRTRRHYARRSGPFVRYAAPSNAPARPQLASRHKPLHKASDVDLEKRLALVARQKTEGTLGETERILRYIHEKRHLQPTPSHYEAQIVANTAPGGSIDNVKKILAEMQVAGLSAGALVDNAVLEVIESEPVLSGADRY